MNFEFSEKSIALQKKMQAFMEENIYPHEIAYREYVHSHPWNPVAYEGFSPGLSNLEYAPLAELMGRVKWSAEVFNCSAPDTGNMEVLAKYGTVAQQEKWLTPLMNGEIRSAFLMTEPQVASSDATNIETSIVRDGDQYLINGTKWWSSGAMDPACKVYIVMGTLK